MKNNLNDFLDIKKNEIETEEFSIKDNLLKFSDLTIQLSNISYLSAGKKKFKMPIMAIIILIISLFLLSILPIIGFLLLIASGGYIWYLYNDYQKEKQFLTFNLNSGQIYRISFEKKDFLNKVRETVEFSMNNKNKNFEINIGKQEVFSGDYHSHNVQGSNIKISSNSHQKTDSSVKIGDIKDSSMSGVAFGSNNIVRNKEQNISYNWAELRTNLKSLLSNVSEDSSLTEASIQALQAAEKEDKQQFEIVIQNNKSIFLSNLFQNTASQFLVQIINNILGI
ncbi:hypothetical protein HBP70_10205 [Listeria welshimeri]|uniref:Uncharacterized protein n=1 Tax=Listeria welshimeri TaxID=1643 RepID=A0A7X0T3M1_LISWE|nr:hypothetical protein [Listeria welshimeri]MBC1321968.1 hypothetical protein [Listeria welshimeri]MBC2015437.1 hypothetical protein [Listeria welshimeri]MBC2277994.1 hypothetical protein [Listeria welshimeri]MBC2360383.1 hypothetical protein [Listeria welshimeri]